jgi:hypothetical protein
MSVITYRSVDPGDESVKYVCEHAYVTGPYLAESGPSQFDAETVLCLDCMNRLSAGEKEERVHAPNRSKMQSLGSLLIH